MAELVDELRLQPIPIGAKGWPLSAAGIPASEVASQNWRLLEGDVALPALILRNAELRSNIATMAAWCREAGVLLAPHGKTTMAPAILELQTAAGAWALTAATPAHAQLYRQFGVPRVLYANQLVERHAIAWFVAELESDPDFELITLVDSAAGAQLLGGEMALAGGHRRVDVLVEVGELGGRAGARTIDQALDAARAVAAEPRLRLIGVEGFEGLLRSTDANQEIPRVTAFLDRVSAAMEAIAAENLFEDSEEILVSVGGSAFFDYVVRQFAGGSVRGRPTRTLLRSGAYVTQDDGAYRVLSALGDRAAQGQVRLSNAIEVWAAVLSRPEPDLIILGMGKRDVASDIGLPQPALWKPAGGGDVLPLAGSIVALTDQHAHVRISDESPLQIGDLVGVTISHPCTTLDRWRLIPVVDSEYRIIDAIHTFF